MKPEVKFGLIMGAVGLFANMIVAAIFGFCGPLFSIAIGAVTGFLLTTSNTFPDKSDAARSGGIAGLIAGVGLLVGQLIAVTVVLTLLPALGVEPLVGTAPTPGRPDEFLAYAAGGAGVGLCCGVMDIFAAAGGSAGIAYLTAKEEASTPSVI